MIHTISTILSESIQGYTSAQDYLTRTENVWNANCPAHDETEPFTASWAGAWFLGICDLLNRGWSLNLDADVSQCIRRNREAATIR